MRYTVVSFKNDKFIIVNNDNKILDDNDGFGYKTEKLADIIYRRKNRKVYFKKYEYYKTKRVNKFTENYYDELLEFNNNLVLDDLTGKELLEFFNAYLEDNDINHIGLKVADILRFSSIFENKRFVKRKN